MERRAAIVADINRRVREVGKHKRIDWDGIETSAVDSVATKLKVTLPHVMTFHALAYAVVHPEESLLYNGAEGEEQALSRVFAASHRRPPSVTCVQKASP
jgi:DNA helicase-4